LRRKCWSVVNFIVALFTRVAPHSSSEICQPFFENPGTRPGQNIAQGEQVLREKKKKKKKVPGGTFIAQTAPNWAPYPQLYNI
jgi:hypothetical protein